MFLRVALFAGNVVVLNYGCAVIVTIDLILLAHLVYRIAILVVKFVSILVKDVDAFVIGDVIELFLVGRRDFHAVIISIVSAATPNCKE